VNHLDAEGQGWESGGHDQNSVFLFAFDFDALHLLAFYVALHFNDGLASAFFLLVSSVKFVFNCSGISGFSGFVRNRFSIRHLNRLLRDSEPEKHLDVGGLGLNQDVLGEGFVVFSGGMLYELVDVLLDYVFRERHELDLLGASVSFLLVETALRRVLARQYLDQTVSH